MTRLRRHGGTPEQHTAGPGSLCLGCYAGRLQLERDVLVCGECRRHVDPGPFTAARLAELAADHGVTLESVGALRRKRGRALPRARTVTNEGAAT